MGHTCTEGELCSACALAAALGAASLVLVQVTLAYIPQAMLLLTTKGRPMALVFVASVCGIGLLWLYLWKLHARMAAVASRCRAVRHHEQAV
mmetsp:Transcript_11172/g.45475  ORF Transcript_11172/g.45475 Transcript_11172/m.45475 type:complete len:92 (-) Transcript_11172:34-309(-)